MPPKGWRKHKITDEHIQQIERMAAIGSRQTDMAYILGFNPKTFEDYIKYDERISGAIKKGEAFGAAEIEKTAYNMAKSGQYPAMTMFWLKCRRCWKEVSQVEHTVEKIEFKTKIGEEGQIFTEEKQFEDIAETSFVQ